MRKGFVLIIVIFFLCSSVGADDFIYHGSFLWNDVRAVVNQGDYLFCAFYNGIAAVDIADDSAKKDIASKLEIEGYPFRLHLFGNLLAAEKENGDIDLIDISNPVDLVRLGSFLSPDDLYDLERLGDYLYAAVGYNGLWRFDISDPASVTFDDSSMAGINIVAVESYGGRLLALDDYNGVLVYEPDGNGIGNPVSELLFPERGLSLSVVEDTIYAGIKPAGFMVGSISDVYNPVYLETRPSFIRADFIEPVPGGLVIFNSYNGFELIYNEPPGQGDYLFPISGARGYGTVYERAGSSFFVMPNESKGFVGYNIDDPDQIDHRQPDFEYKYPGPITQLEFLNDRLHVIGPGNRYEIYDVSLLDSPVLSGKIEKPPYCPVGICTKGDTVFIADGCVNSIFTAIDAMTGNPHVRPDFFAVLDSIHRPFVVEDYFYDGDLVYFHDGRFFNGSSRSAEGYDANRIRWGFDGGITALIPFGSLLYQVDTENRLHVYSIDRFLDLHEEMVMDLPGRVKVMQIYDTLLYLAGDDLFTYSIANSTNPGILHITAEPDGISEIDLDYPEIACAAANGVFVYDVSSDLPQLLFSGAAPAATVSRHGQTFAASDGRAVKIFTLPQTHADDYQPHPNFREEARISGYPNPFNLSIRLELEGFDPRAGPIAIEVFDILGRKQRGFSVDAGRLDQQITWDGTGPLSAEIPSGVYFIRARNESQEAGFKAVLVK